MAAAHPSLSFTGPSPQTHPSSGGPSQVDTTTGAAGLHFQAPAAPTPALVSPESSVPPMAPRMTDFLRLSLAAFLIP